MYVYISSNQEVSPLQGKGRFVIIFDFAMRTGRTAWTRNNRYREPIVDGAFRLRRNCSQRWETNAWTEYSYQPVPIITEQKKA